jgi:hypothetical protein
MARLSRKRRQKTRSYLPRLGLRRRALYGAHDLCVTIARRAVLTLSEPWRVEVVDALLSGIERVFGEQVAELR